MSPAFALNKAQELESQAQITLKQFSFWNKTEDAAELFAKAAAQYRIAKNRKIESVC